MKYNRKYSFTKGDIINGWEFISYEERSNSKTKFGLVGCPVCKVESVRGLHNLIYGKSKCCIKCAAKPKQYRKLYGTIPAQLVNHWKGSAKKRSIDFSVDPFYLDQLLMKQNFKCALSGVDIQIAQKYKNTGRAIKNIFDFSETTVSLDRVDSNKGYLPGNVQFLHKRVNCMKNNMTENMFLDFCNKISKLSKNKKNA